MRWVGFFVGFLGLTVGGCVYTFGVMGKYTEYRWVTWVERRLCGGRQCIWRMEGDVKAEEFPSGRKAGHRRGQRCGRWVSPTHLAERGLPLCGIHWPIFCERAEADAESRQALRDKYDPGPLPLDE